MRGSPKGLVLPAGDPHAPLAGAWPPLSLPFSRRPRPSRARYPRYATRACAITNTPVVNGARRKAELGALRQENEALREQLRTMQARVRKRSPDHARAIQILK